MDKKVEAVKWVKWLWSLWPAGWSGLFILSFIVVASIVVGSWMGGGPAYIISPIVVSFSAFMLGGIGVMIYEWYENNWVKTKAKVKRWWEDKP